ncbi:MULTISPECIES: enoyl-CoA hydratase-related protein [Paraburkholderia]|uniref:enoyl-CoA hydratase-related protein n=1 Tax=Paraburkholderia TaxID=1822464 RepID=UPI001B254D5C|nr:MULTISPECIES: enoyl-CoA hydratase-related protein [Paraburkholderia]MCX4139953.1 enoyl-CoA hydratase-related protein [Paraburkholderia aspalathi]MCX4154914.1 enoyl-CoA hydratase-related protein [Paraburkholderia aspalathi]MDN7164326.1 enoyl-CoA hydratase-related protein [Paraburkholderia sp. SECH2]MDN7172640.1 enoyl-CoA hydratase-related protein [Paraburkholderia sp. SEWSISQ10-3 4]MDQ6392811.1 enoyl-CoA hydratase-related protein [Paraburkholderia aspalathi]
MSNDVSAVRGASAKQTSVQVIDANADTAGATSENGTYETIKIDRRERVGLITLYRPKNLNALNVQMSREVLAALTAFDQDDGIGAIVITGNGRAFAAGADIEEMVDKSFADWHAKDLFAEWDRIATISKPIIAAVGGYALGGGCELAMACDFIIAAHDAQFGQPEIKLGIPPGIGGSQRLTRAVGKSLAMDLILTGRNLRADEALAAGLVARVVPSTDLLQTALETAHTIAGYNLPAVRLAKEAVNRAFETPLKEGVLHERRLFHAAFATEGQKEGMYAFLAKRAPVFRHR